MQRQSHSKSAKILGGALFISGFLAGCGGDAPTGAGAPPTLAPPTSDFKISVNNAPALNRQVVRTLDGLRNSDGGLAQSIISLIASTSSTQTDKYATLTVGENQDFVVVCGDALDINGNNNLKGTVTLFGNPTYLATGNVYEFTATDCITKQANSTNPNTLNTYKLNGKISITLTKVIVSHPSQAALATSLTYGPTYTDTIPNIFFPTTTISATPSTVPQKLNFATAFYRATAVPPAQSFPTAAPYAASYSILSVVKLEDFSIIPVSSTTIPTRTYNGTIEAGFSQNANGNTAALPATGFDFKANGLVVVDSLLGQQITTQTLDSMRVTGYRFVDANNANQFTARITALYNVTGNTTVAAADSVPVGNFAFGVETTTPPLVYLTTVGNNDGAQFRSGGFKLKTSNKSNMTVTATNVRADGLGSNLENTTILTVGAPAAELEIDADGNGVFEKTGYILW
jgi:hypothetical protein